jgi:hypothetical protein
MSGRVFEKDGEKYIISENVDPDDLDTETLVEKDQVNKLVEEIRKISSSPEVQAIDTEPEPVFTPEPAAVFVFQHGNKELPVLGFLVSVYHDEHKAVYNIKFDITEAIQLSFYTQDSKNLRLKQIKVNRDDRECLLELNKENGHIQTFSINKFEDNNAICELSLG